MYGMPADPPVPAAVVAAFHNILPETGWFVGNHPGCANYNYDRKDYKEGRPRPPLRAGVPPGRSPIRPRNAVRLAAERHGAGVQSVRVRAAVSVPHAGGRGLPHRRGDRPGGRPPRPGPDRRRLLADGHRLRLGRGRDVLHAVSRLVRSVRPAWPPTTPPCWRRTRRTGDDLHSRTSARAAQTAEAVIYIEKACWTESSPGRRRDRYWAVIDERIDAGTVCTRWASARPAGSSATATYTAPPPRSPRPSPTPRPVNADGGKVKTMSKTIPIFTAWH